MRLIKRIGIMTIMLLLLTLGVIGQSKITNPIDSTLINNEGMEKENPNINIQEEEADMIAKIGNEPTLTTNIKINSISSISKTDKIQISVSYDTTAKTDEKLEIVMAESKINDVDAIATEIKIKVLEKIKKDYQRELSTLKIDYEDYPLINMSVKK